MARTNKQMRSHSAVAPSYEILKLRKVSREVFEHTLHNYFSLPIDELEKVRNDKKAPTLDVLVSSLLLNAIDTGCSVRFRFLIDRILPQPSYTFPGNHIEESQAASAPAAPLLPTENDGPIFIVEMNDNGKFTRARPRLVDVTPTGAQDEQPVNP